MQKEIGRALARGPLRIICDGVRIEGRWICIEARTRTNDIDNDQANREGER
jgi:hypothetical protein